jgi:hypothetical protein
MQMEKKLVKDAKDIPSDFSIENFFEGASKSVRPKSQGQSVVSDKQTKGYVLEKTAHSIRATLHSEQTEPDDNPIPDIPAKKTVPAKQRRNSLIEYRETFLKVPKISDRKNVFISNSTRELIVGIVRRFGGEKTSVSGFLENLVLHHFEEYGEDFEALRKL